MQELKKIPLREKKAYGFICLEILRIIMHATSRDELVASFSTENIFDQCVKYFDDYKPAISSQSYENASISEIFTSPVKFFQEIKPRQYFSLAYYSDDKIWGKLFELLNIQLYQDDQDIWVNFQLRAITEFMKKNGIKFKNKSSFAETFISRLTSADKLEHYFERTPAENHLVISQQIESGIIAPMKRARKPIGYIMEQEQHSYCFAKGKDNTYYLFDAEKEILLQTDDLSVLKDYIVQEIKESADVIHNVYEIMSVVKVEEKPQYLPAFFTPDLAIKKKNAQDEKMSLLKSGQQTSCCSIL